MEYFRVWAESYMIFIIPKFLQVTTSIFTEM